MRLDVLFHGSHARRVIKQPVDLESNCRQVVAPQCRTLLKQVIGIALLLPRNRIHHHHDEVPRQRFRCGQSSGFSHQHVSGCHVFIHIRGVADHAHGHPMARGNAFSKVLKLSF